MDEEEILHVRFESFIEELRWIWKRNQQGQVPWGKSICLSQRYFESLLAHAVPLDSRAIGALSHSPMAMDIYCWLAHRLRRIDPENPQFVAWKNLYDQFGYGYTQIFNFKRKFRELINQVLWQYPDARSRVREEHNKGYWLRHTPPPVPYKPRVSFKDTDAVGDQLRGS